MKPELKGVARTFTGVRNVAELLEVVKTRRSGIYVKTKNGNWSDAGEWYREVWLVLYTFGVSVKVDKLEILCENEDDMKELEKRLGAECIEVC